MDITHRALLKGGTMPEHAPRLGSLRSTAFALRVALLAWAAVLILGEPAAPQALKQFAPESADATIKEVSLGTSDTDELDPKRTGTQFPEGTTKVVVWYRWAGAKPGMRFDNRWHYEGQAVREQGETVQEPAGTATWYLNFSTGALPTGSYRVELLENGTIITTIPFHIGPAPPSADGPD
jgi:hypothetical protein